MALPNGKKKSVDEISVVLRKFGDEQSTLLDQFERLSFEVQLNQAILGRSMSEPSVKKRTTSLRSQFQAPPAAAAEVVRKGRRGSGFNRVLKKLLKPILGRKGRKPVADQAQAEADPINPMSWKAFSRSLRL